MMRNLISLPDRVGFYIRRCTYNIQFDTNEILIFAKICSIFDSADGKAGKLK